MTFWPMLMTLLSGDILWRFATEPNHRISIFVALSCRHLVAHHELTSEMHSSTTVRICGMLDGMPLLKPCTSYANKWWCRPCLWNKSFTSSTYIINRFGPRTHPWGMPKGNGKLTPSCRHGRLGFDHKGTLLASQQRYLRHQTDVLERPWVFRGLWLKLFMIRLLWWTVSYGNGETLWVMSGLFAKSCGRCTTAKLQWLSTT